MQKILVTGGAGFIGSATADFLAEKGFGICIVDNLFMGKKENIPKEASFYKADIRNKASLEKIFAKEKPDFAMHFAAHMNLRQSIKNPFFNAGVNVTGTLNLLEACKKFSIKKIILASSGGAVYGEPLELPVPESHTLQPLSPYGASKIAVEKYAYSYWKNFGLDFVALRYANVFGPRQNPKSGAGIISIFSEALLHKKKPFIFGSGEQTRDFVFSRDVAEANFLALTKKTKNRIFNIGAGKEVSVNRVFGLLKNFFGSGKEAIRKPEIAGEVKRIFLDNSLAKEELGWVPKTGFEEGMKITAEWFVEKNRKK
ncbi:MAG: GDP-mannose 4,6-dehydratase [Candidatus ainarchaeum sp.]|nr:GDP-mannose 4,6-dehydratase [Candidatus ainarchaeum sp.]